MVIIHHMLFVEVKWPYILIISTTSSSPTQNHDAHSNFLGLLYLFYLYFFFFVVVVSHLYYAAAAPAQSHGQSFHVTCYASPQYKSPPDFMASITFLPLLPLVPQPKLPIEPTFHQLHKDLRQQETQRTRVGVEECSKGQRYTSNTLGDETPKWAKRLGSAELCRDSIGASCSAKLIKGRWMRGREW